MKKLSTLTILFFITALSFGQIVINEVLYDPSNNELDGDANGDGEYSQAEDEFIEFVNTGDTEIDMSGYKIFDTEGLEADPQAPGHIFPEGSIVIPGGAIVVFGGGVPTGTFGNAIVQTSTSGDMNMNNSGDIMTLTDASDAVIVTFDIEPLSNNPNESYTRNPDITGEFEQHNDNFEILFSPGTMVDGMPFAFFIPVTSITVQGEGGATSIDTDGGTLQMEAMVMPADASDQSVTWSVLPEVGVVSIDENGLLTAEADGAVSVYATANDGTEIFGVANITITNNSPILVEEIIVEGSGGATSITTAGGELQMEVTVLPENATDQFVLWSIEPESGVATISGTGLLTAVGNGTVTVTASSLDGSGVTGSADIEISNQNMNVSEYESSPFKVYPNPVSNELFIQSDILVDEIRVFSITGKLVQTYGTGTRQLDMSDLNEGIYIVSIVSADVTTTLRVVRGK